MGICSSKSDSKSLHAKPDAAAAAEPPGKAGVLDNAPASAAAASSAAAAEQPAAASPAAAAGSAAPANGGVDAPPTPATPARHPAAGGENEHSRDEEGDGAATPHQYKSGEKPAKSALRPKSAEAPRGDAKSDYSRRSSSGMSTVGFAVSLDASESGGHHKLVGADSISLKKILDMFYDKVVADAALGPYFDGIDMIKLKTHQLRFMGLAFGGKELVFEEDPNLNLRKIHYHLIRDRGLTLDHWEQFVTLFDQTMDELEKDLPLETREQAMRSIHATRHYFVPIGQETAFTNASIAAMPEGELPLARRSGSAVSSKSVG